MRATPIDPTLLVVFVVVAETLSFSRAAKRVGVTTGTVSRRIARLEEIVGVELLRRNTHSVTLTQAGQVLLGRTAEPVRALSAAAESLAERDAPLAGEIRLTAPNDIGIEVLPDVLRQFSLAHPGVHFHVRLANERVDLVADGYDMALRASSRPFKNNSLVVRKLGALGGGFVASTAYLRSRGVPAEVGDPQHDWLGFAPLDGAPGPARRPARQGRGRAPALVANDFFLLRELCCRGMGIAVLPSFMSAPLVRAGLLAEVLSPAPAFGASLFLVVPSHRKAAPHLAAFRRHLVTAFATLLPPSASGERSPAAAPGA